MVEPATPTDKVPTKYQIDEDTLQRLYQWVDEIPLSRPKRNIARDFSDGVLMAEIVHHFSKKLVELHNYSAANGFAQKLYNWDTLNTKVFKRIRLTIPRQDLERVCLCVPGAIEWVLLEFQKAMEQYLQRKPSQKPDSPGSASPLPYATTPGLPSQYAFPSGVSPMVHGDPPPAVAVEAPAAFQAPPPPPPPPPPPAQRQFQHEVDAEILVDKEQTIQELRDTVDILEKKVAKLEQLVRLKDSRIHALTAKLQQAGLA